MSPTPRSSNQRSIRLSLALYRALLVAYPATFRRAYGAQMLQVFRDRCRQATQAHGRRGLLTLWFPTLADLLRTALAERLAVSRPLSRPFLIRLCGLLMLVSTSLPLLFVLNLLLRGLFGVHLLPLGALVPEGFGLIPYLVVVSSYVVPWYPVWGQFGLLLCQRTWLGWLGGSLALLGQLLLLWNPLQYISLAPHLLGLVAVPLGLLLWGLAVWAAGLLGRWSVVVSLLFLATGVQGWVAVFVAPRLGSGTGGNFLLVSLDQGVFFWPLWAWLGYALWARQAHLWQVQSRSLPSSSPEASPSAARRTQAREL